MRQPDDFPNVVCWLPHSRAEVMNTMALDVSAPVFAATHYPSLLQERGPGVNSYKPLLEHDYLMSFLDEKEPHVFDVAVGDSGTGKSHFIRWLYNRIVAINEQQKSRWCVKLIPRSSANLADVVYSLLGDFAGENIDELKRELAHAGQKTTVQGAGQRVLNEYAVLLDPTNQQGSTPDPPSDVDIMLYQEVLAMLPAFLYDTAIRKWLLHENDGIVTRLAHHVMGQRQQRSDLDGLQGKLKWTEVDLRVPVTVSTSAGRDALELATALLTDDDARDIAVRILNDRFSDVLNNLLGLKRGDLRRAMYEVRRQLREDNRELVLLIEDMSVTHGLDHDLLEALFVRSRDEVQVGGKEVCKLRSVIGITNADYDHMLDNVRQGRVRKTLFFNVRFSPAAEGGTGEVGRHAVTDFASRYLNATRYGIDELEKWLNDPRRPNELPSYCKACKCPNISKCHEAFGHFLGRGLYPFTEKALGRLYEKAAAKVAATQGRTDREGQAFRPRLMVAEVLNYILEEAERTLPRKQFPSAGLAQSYKLDAIGSAVEVAIAEQFQDNVTEGERIIAALKIYAERPQDGRVEPLLGEVFGLPPLSSRSSSSGTLTLTVEFEGVLCELRKQLHEHGVELSIPTRLEFSKVNCAWNDTPVSAALAELPGQLPGSVRLLSQGRQRYALIEGEERADPYDRWAAGQALEQLNVNEARALLASAIAGAIDWDQQGLASVARYFGQRYINLEGQVVRPASGGLVVLNVARSPHNALAIRGLRDDFRGKTDEESSRMVEQAARLVRRLADEVVTKLRDILTSRTDPPPAEVAAQYLAMGAVIRGQLPPNASDADALAASLALWVKPSEMITGSSEWQSLWAAYTETGAAVRDWLRSFLTCSKGARVGDCINPTPILSAIRRVRASGIADPLPATTQQWSVHFASVRKLADDVQARLGGALHEERAAAKNWLAAVDRLVNDADWTQLCKAMRKVVEAAAAEELVDGAIARACDRMAKLSGLLADCITASRKLVIGNGQDDGADLRAIAHLDHSFLRDSGLFLKEVSACLADICRNVGKADLGRRGDISLLRGEIAQRLTEIGASVTALLASVENAGKREHKVPRAKKQEVDAKRGHSIPPTENTHVVSMTPVERRSLTEWVVAAGEAVEDHRRMRESSLLAHKLQTRFDELANPRIGLQAAETAVQLGALYGLRPFDRKIVSRLQKLADKISRLTEAFATDPSTLTEPGALPEAEWTEAYEYCETHILGCWKDFAMKELPSDGILAIFEKHARWFPTVQQIRKLKAANVEAARCMPAIAADIHAVKQNLDAAKEACAALPDLPDKIKRFLPKTVSPGVVLCEVLNDPEVLEWIKAQGMDRELRVISGQITAY